jgi:hypothetical protein
VGVFLFPAVPFHVNTKTCAYSAFMIAMGLSVLIPNFLFDQAEVELFSFS